MKVLEEIIVRIKQSPLFYLFISSRELFHSNFWYWLYTLNRYEAAILFDPSISNSSSIEFIREYGIHYEKEKLKIDLVISVDEKHHTVIENKVKDYPRNDQLQKIKGSGSFQTGTHFVLISLFSPVSLCSGWMCINYRELSQKIDPYKFTSNEYYISLIKDYCQFINDLNELAVCLPTTDMYDFTIAYQHELYKKLNGILWEGYLKMRSAICINNFISTYNPFKIIPDYYINNQHATLHFPVELDYKYRIGVQIEGVQFRKFISGPNPGKFAESLLVAEIFFSKNIGDTAGKKLLNRYDPDFRYQYVKIDKGTPQEFLYEKINNELLFIHNNIDRIKELMPI